MTPALRTAAAEIVADELLVLADQLQVSADRGEVTEVNPQAAELMAARVRAWAHLLQGNLTLAQFSAQLAAELRQAQGLPHQGPPPDNLVVVDFRRDRVPVAAAGDPPDGAA